MLITIIAIADFDRSQKQQVCFQKINVRKLMTKQTKGKIEKKPQKERKTISVWLFVRFV